MRIWKRLFEVLSGIRKELLALAAKKKQKDYNKESHRQKGRKD
jgi:hypothetical protein